MLTDGIKWKTETNSSLLEQKARREGGQRKKEEQQPNNKTGNDVSIDTATGYLAGWLPPVFSDRPKFNM